MKDHDDAAGDPGDAASPRRRARRGLALLAATVLVGVAVGELALSRVEAFRPWPRYAPGQRADDLPADNYLRVDPPVGWSMRPDFAFRHHTAEYDVVYRSNAQGIRGERDLDEPVTGPRIVVVGDSYTFGIGVDYADTFCARIEAGLPGSAVYDFGMPGYGVDQMWLALRERAFACAPDLVVAAICDADLARCQSAYSLGNGINKPAFVLDGGELRPMTEDDRANPLLQFLDTHSRIWMALRQVVRLANYRRPLSEWWYLNQAILDGLRADCAERDLPVLFVYVPTPECRPFPTLHAYCEARGVDLVDLTRDLPEPTSGLFYPKDRHFTPRGHAHAAERILARIEERGWLAARSAAGVAPASASKAD